MAYPPNPTTNQTLNVGDIPLGSVLTPTGLANAGLNALQGGPGAVDTSDATRVYAPVATYTPDGNDLSAGATTDAAVTGDNPGTRSAKLRGLNKLFADVWDSVNHWLQVKVMNTVAVSGTVNTLHGTSIDATNSSTTLLTANSAFTGISQSALNYSAISLEVLADQASATNGLSVQQSTDGTNWDIKDTFSIVASTAFQTTINLIGQYYRVVYTNGTAGQGTFRLQTVKQTSEVVLPRTLTALGNLKVAIQEDNTTGLATAANQTAANSTFTSIAASMSSSASSENTIANAVSGGKMQVQASVTPSGGSTPYHNLSAATTNATNVKSAACQMYGYSISNTNASTRYVKFYDKTTAPSVGTDTPKHTVQIPGNGTVIRAIPEGMKFVNGFGWATTVNVADTDSTAVGANDLVIDFSLNS